MKLCCLYMKQYHQNIPKRLRNCVSHTCQMAFWYIFYIFVNLYHLAPHNFIKKDDFFAGRPMVYPKLAGDFWPVPPSEHVKMCNFGSEDYHGMGPRPPE